MAVKKGRTLLFGLPVIALLVCWLTSMGCGGNSANERRVQKELVAAAERDERPINFTFRMVDQDGNGARNYGFKLNLDRLHRFLWIWPYTREECHHVSTDERGYVYIFMPGKKASYLALKEVDIDNYIFSKELGGLGLVPMSRFTDVAKPVELKVIRHGTPSKLHEYVPPSLIVQARKKNTFTFSLSDGFLKSGPSDGELQIEVENGLEVCNGYVKKKSPASLGSRADDSQLVRVCLRTRLGYALLKADDEIVSDAPTAGYVSEICVGTVENPRWSPCKFFLKKEDGSAYYWFSLEIGCSGNREVFVDLEGRTNSNGSTNLYKDRWPYKDEFKLYSERCP